MVNFSFTDFQQCKVVIFFVNERGLQPITALQNARRFLVARGVYKGKFLKFNTKQPNFQSLSPL